MGRISKSEKAVKNIVQQKIIKQPGYFSVVIKKDDTVIFSNRKISKVDLTKVYFKNLENNIKNHPEYTAKDIVNIYKKLWSKYKIHSVYTDSYGHKWTKNSFLADSWLVSYVTDKLNEFNKL